MNRKTPLPTTITRFYFGENGSAQFACLHEPEVRAPLGQAVLLCSPFGFEELSTYRPLRELADSLASRGHSVLRFDYAGTGDSFSDPPSGEALSGWVASVVAAATSLQQRSGRRQVVLVGLRLGAAIAWLAARSGLSVAAWAGVLPVLSGRQYVREMQALQAAAGLKEGLPPELGLESGGFVINPRTREALSATDLRSPPALPAPEVLLVEREDLPVPPAVVERLGGLPGTLTRHLASDLGDLLAEPHRAKVPHASWARVADWIDALPVHQPGAAQAVVLPDEACGDGLSERVVNVPTGAADLLAVLTRCEARPASGRMVLLLNAGAIRRVGPGRCHVHLARELARGGDQVLRVDLSGLGDSPTAAGAPAMQVYSPTAVAEVRAAVEWVLARPGVQRCVVVGLCAGAYHGLKAAIEGAPVHQVIAINPLTFDWDGEQPGAARKPMRHEVISEVARYRSMLFTLEPWRKLLRGDVHLLRAVRLLARGLVRPAARIWRDMARRLGVPLEGDLGHALESTCARGVRIDFIFSEDEPGEALLRDQAGALLQRLRRQGRMDIAHVSGADHVFLNLAPRTRMMQIVRDRLGPGSHA